MTTSPLLSPQGNQEDVENGLVLTPKFDASGLITAVTVDAKTNVILMVAHMNAEARARAARFGSRAKPPDKFRPLKKSGSTATKIAFYCLSMSAAMAGAAIPEDHNASTAASTGCPMTVQ